MYRFLSIVWYKIYPPEFGGQKGIASFNESLSKLHPVDVLCASSNAVITDYEKNVLPDLPVSKWQFINPVVWYKIHKQILKHQYTHLIIEHPYYGFIGAYYKNKKRKFILHSHNIEAKRFKQLKKWWWFLLEVYEKWCMQKADLVLFKTYADKNYAISKYKIETRKTHVLEYGIKKTSVGKNVGRKKLIDTYQLEPQTYLMVFAGTLDYQPNAAAVEFIYNELEPLLNIKLHTPYKIIICGRNNDKNYSYLKQLKNSNILQAGYVDDIDLYIAGADAFINPVKDVFGVQTKTIDAIALEQNVVLFAESARELPDYLINEKVFIANNVNEFVLKVSIALETNKVTPQQFFNDYAWDHIVHKFVKHLQQLN
jgi:polysaccharide biosynthesis protein PslH